MVDQVYANVNVAGQLKAALPAAPSARFARTGRRRPAHGLLRKRRSNFLGTPARCQEAWQNRAAPDRPAVHQQSSRTSRRAITLSGKRRVHRPAAAHGAAHDDSRAACVSGASTLPPGRRSAQGDVEQTRSAPCQKRGEGGQGPDDHPSRPSPCSCSRSASTSTRAARRHAMFVVGIDLVIAGLIVLIARNVAGNQIVNRAGRPPRPRDPPADRRLDDSARAFSSDIGQSIIIVGLAGDGGGVAGRRPAPGGCLPARCRPVVPRAPRSPRMASSSAILLLIVLLGPRSPATRKADFRC